MDMSKFDRYNSKCRGTMHSIPIELCEKPLDTRKMLMRGILKYW